MTAPSVDLNADVGETAASATGDDNGDEAILAEVTSASVACGFHAGDPLTMRRTLEAAVRLGVTVGAHPSYPDRPGFGRRPLDIPPGQVAADVLYQVGALAALARAAGTRVRYVKPHGALYHRLAEDEACARAVIEAVAGAGDGDLVLLVQPGAVAAEVAGDLGMGVATEAFADRAYAPDGRLVDRSVAGALVTDPDEVAARAVSLALEGTVRAVDGSVVAVAATSICVHGDTPGSVALARSIRRALRASGVTLVPFVR